MWRHRGLYLPVARFWWRGEERVDRSLALKSSHQRKPVTLLYVKEFYFLCQRSSSSYLRWGFNLFLFDFFGRNRLTSSCRSSGNHMGRNSGLRGFPPWRSLNNSSWSRLLHRSAAVPVWAAVLGEDVERGGGSREVRDLFSSVACGTSWKWLGRGLAILGVSNGEGLIWGGEKSLHLVGNGWWQSRGGSTGDLGSAITKNPKIWKPVEKGGFYTWHGRAYSILCLNHHGPCWPTVLWRFLQLLASPSSRSDSLQRRTKLYPCPRKFKGLLQKWLKEMQAVFHDSVTVKDC